MRALEPRTTVKSLILTDPRRYALSDPPEGALAKAARRAANPLQYEKAVELAAFHLGNGEDTVLRDLLGSARDWEEHSLFHAITTTAACQHTNLGSLDEAVHVVFAIPLTVHPEAWPFEGRQPRRSWLDVSRLADVMRFGGMLPQHRKCEVLPNLYSVADLDRVSFSAWRRIAQVLPVDRALAAESLLPQPEPLLAFDSRFAQARLILGAVTTSREGAAAFIEDGAVHESEFVAEIVEELQAQMGFDSGLRVVGGLPTLALAALSNARHMHNCAQLSCLADLAASDLAELVALKAEVVTDSEGDGHLRFAVRSADVTWRLSKSESWDGQRTHWRILLDHLPARYVKLQLAISTARYSAF